MRVYVHSDEYALVYAIDQLVGFLMMEPTHPGLSPRLDTGARIFLNLF